MSLLRASSHFGRATRHVTQQQLRRLSVEPNISANADKEKRFVRIAGPASYANTQDLSLFLQSHGVSNPNIPQYLVQGQSDVFQNHTVWFFETPSQTEATDISARISGRVLGLKLVRAAPVDKRLYETMVAPSESSEKRVSLRRRMNIIAPRPEERGRALLAKNLQSNLQPRLLWSFFSAYDVVDIRVLRRPGVASVVFETAEEAHRALRERSNLHLQNQQQIQLKLHM